MSALADPADLVARKLNGWLFTGPGVLAPMVELNASVETVAGERVVCLQLAALPDLVNNPTAVEPIETRCFLLTLIEIEGFEAAS